MTALVRRYFKLGIIVTIAHFITTLSLLFWTIGVGMQQFDNPDMQIPLAAKIAEYIMLVLAQPYFSISLWIPGMSNIRVVLDWIFFLLNSVFWGFGLSLIWYLIKRGNQQAPTPELF